MLPGMDVHARLKATFPWFDDYRWAWSYNADGEGAPAYAIRPSPAGARGTLEVFMPRAPHEQSNGVTAWLIRECRPRYEVPASRLMMALGDRSRSDSRWAHLDAHSPPPRTS